MINQELKTKPSASFIENMSDFYTQIKSSPYFKTLKQQKKSTLFLSVGQPDQRAVVFMAHQKSFEQAWANIKSKLFVF